MVIIMRKKITVLFLNNNFYGSYSSNQIFFDEIIVAFRKKGINVLVASKVNEAMEMYEKEKINFSLSFSKYKYFYNGLPLYEKYKIINYQWVSDNPLKMNIDFESEWIKYIFIDNEYPLIIDNKIKNECLYRPLGFLEDNIMMPLSQKNGRLLFPCKIRNLNELFAKINESSISLKIKKFLDFYNRDTSFIKSITKFYKEENFFDLSIKEYFFRLTNEYIRAEKRLWVIEHIEAYKVDILSEDYGNKIKSKNVTFVSPVKYSMLNKIINNYSLVINVDPNYHSCIHDRFIKAVSSGSICITNNNELTSTITDVTYSFERADSIMEAIELSKKYNMHEQQLLSILPYSWEQSVIFILNDYIKGRYYNEISNTL